MLKHLVLLLAITTSLFPGKTENGIINGTKVVRFLPRDPTYYHSDDDSIYPDQRITQPPISFLESFKNAVRVMDCESVRFMVDNNAHMRYFMRYSFIHLAEAANKYESPALLEQMVNLLHDKGFDINVRTSMHGSVQTYTPLDLISQDRQWAIKVFEEYGAKRSSYWDTFLDFKPYACSIQ